VSERERTVEPDSEAVGSDGEAPQFRRPDAAAESFLELDAELDTGPAAETGTDSGLVVDAGTVDPGTLPDGYPLDTVTDEVLELTVDTGLDERVVYLSWPDEATDVPLVWYLDATGIELRELYGREVRLTEDAGHTTLATPDEPPRGSRRWYWGVLGGAALVVALAGPYRFGAQNRRLVVGDVGCGESCYRPVAGSFGPASQDEHPPLVGSLGLGAQRPSQFHAGSGRRAGMELTERPRSHLGQYRDSGVPDGGGLTRVCGDRTQD